MQVVLSHKIPSIIYMYNRLKEQKSAIFKGHPFFSCIFSIGGSYFEAELIFFGFAEYYEFFEDSPLEATAEIQITITKICKQICDSIDSQLLMSYVIF